MDRFAIFVDAGYLYAEGGKLSHDTGDRLRLKLNFKETVSALTNIGREHSGFTIFGLIGMTQPRTLTQPLAILQWLRSRV